MSDEIVIPAPSDYHLHLRQAPVTRAVAPASAWAGRVLVMPNTEPPILTGPQAAEYGMLCGTALPRTEIVTTIKLTTATTPEIVREAYRAGVAAAKLYPAGVTTNSHDGIPPDWLVDPVPPRFADVLGAMADCGMVLCVHGEMPGCATFSSGNDRSKTESFLDWLTGVLFRFNKLRAVLEHVSTAEEVAYVQTFGDRLAATITPHHLVMTLDDVIGDRLRPHNFCKPVVKLDRDRRFLVQAAVMGNPNVFLGTDSAPHPVGSKECAEGCAGCFNAHATLGTVAEVFEKAGALDRLAAFTSGNGDAFYRRETVKRRIVLEKKPYTVPDDVRVPMPNGTDRLVRPWRAGETLAWSWRGVV